MLSAPATPSPLQRLTDPTTEKAGVEVWLKRDDLLHPLVQGNKWRKLKYNLTAARQQHKTALLTFGGAFSNHLRATAAAGHLYGLHTIGMVRCEAHEASSPALKQAASLGMELHFLGRAVYRLRHHPEWLTALAAQFPQALLLPEGGSNAEALPGCAEIVEELNGQMAGFQYVLCATGTGGTLAGICSALAPSQTAVGVAVLKGGDFLVQEVNNLLRQAGRQAGGPWQVLTDYHFGGYARQNDQLAQLMRWFGQVHPEVPIEPVYTGKMMAALYDLLDKGFFPKGSTIVALHTGGIYNDF